MEKTGIKMNEKDWEKMHSDSIFMNLKKLRDVGLANESKDGIIGIERLGIRKTGFAKNTNGFYEVCNAKDELLGIIYKFKPWNAFVWEQDIGVIMSSSCLKDVSEYVGKLNTGEKGY